MVGIDLECSLRKFEASLIECSEGVLQIRSSDCTCRNAEQFVYRL
jgi:hypothetical protein